MPIILYCLGMQEKHADWHWIALFLGLVAVESLVSAILMPPLSWDEAWFCLVARARAAFWSALARGAAHGAIGPSLTAFFRETAGLQFMYTVAKPMASFLFTAAALFGGGARWAIGVPDVLAYAGTATIIAAWAHAWASNKKFPRPRFFAGLAVTAAALSPYVMIFNASFYAHPIGGFFLTLGLWLTWRADRTPRASAGIGLAFSLAILSHYYLWPIVLPMAAYAAAQAWRRRDNLKPFIAAFLIPFILVISFTTVLAKIGDAKLRPRLLRSYQSELREQLGAVSSGTAARPPGYSYYSSRVAILDGLPSLLLLLAMAALLVRRRRSGGLAPIVVLFAIAVLAIMAARAYGARALSPLLPVGYFLGAAGAAVLLEGRSSRLRTMLVIGLAVIVLAGRLPMFEDLARFSNPWQTVEPLVPTDRPAYVSNAWPEFSCIAGRRFGGLAEFDTTKPGIFIDDGRPWNDQRITRFLSDHAHLISSLPLARLTPRDLWEDEDFGERPTPDRAIRLYRW